MKLKELQKHAQKIMKDLGCLDYESLMLNLVKEIPILIENEKENSPYQEAQGLIRKHLDDMPLQELAEDHHKNVECLTAILMKIVMLQFLDIHNKKTFKG